MKLKLLKTNLTFSTIYFAYDKLWTGIFFTMPHFSKKKKRFTQVLIYFNHLFQPQ